MRRRIAGVVAVTIGIVLIATVLASRLFTASNAFERLSKTVRPTNTAATYQALNADIAGLSAVGTEFGAKGTTVLAGAFHQTPAQVAQTFATQFPATTKAFLALPQITSDLSRTVTTLDAERGRFARADAIPTSKQSSTSVPWFILITGLLGIFVGLGLLSRIPGSVWIAALLGAVLIATPLVFSLPQKSSAADTMNDHLRPIFATSNITTLQGDLQTLTAMGTELQTKLVPTLAAALKVGPSQVQAFLAANFPVLSTALANFSAGLQRLDSGVALLATVRSDFVDSSRPSLLPIAWTVVGGGIVMLLFALFGLTEPPEAMPEVGGARLRRRPAA